MLHSSSSNSPGRQNRGRIISAAAALVPAFLFVFSSPPASALTWTGKDCSANVAISKVSTSGPVAGGSSRLITFDIGWDFSWRMSAPPSNWDAAWVFVKYRIGGGEWRHATMSSNAAEHAAPAGMEIEASPDGKGIYLFRGGDGTGNVQAPGVSLRWDCGADGLADNALVEVKVLGLVMVYIPEGGFYAGDGAADAAFRKGSNDRRPWLINGEEAIAVTNTASDGYFYVSSKDTWNDVWNANEDPTGAAFVLPADFPKGYQAIYAMKYELTERQYADFLNTLVPGQAANRYNAAHYQKYGYTISKNNGTYDTGHPDRACGFLSPADGYAYADWAGLRPMTELEFEKICRGSGQPAVAWEFAWGTTYSKNTVTAFGSEIDRILTTLARTNSYYSDEGYQPQFPLDAGIFAWPGKSRELSGAAYYGVMDMSTNLSEPCVTVGNRYGRVFTGRNGDGRLGADGFADELDWPQRDGKGGGYRGGCIGTERLHMCTSVRVEAAIEVDNAHRHIPWGFRGVRTIVR